MLTGIIINKTNKDYWIKSLKDKTCGFSTFYKFVGPKPSQNIMTPGKINIAEIPELDPDIILYVIVSDCMVWYIYEQDYDYDCVYMMLLKSHIFKYCHYDYYRIYTRRKQNKIIRSCFKR